MSEKKFLKESRLVEHIDIKKHNVVPLVDDMGKMAFQARNLNRAASIYNMMLEEKDCSIYLTIAGSLFSAGLKGIVVDLLKNNMIDVIVSTGANIVDQDFFEALGFRHYQASNPYAINDNELRDNSIDRIYDTYIDEDELRICDNTIGEIADSLEPRPYSSREFISAMGKYLIDNDKGKDSVVRTAYECNVPIFCPAFSDCSAGFGLVMHQQKKSGKNCVSIDSAKDFLELTKTKLHSSESGLFMLCGGVPKNFTQDIVVAAELLTDDDVKMHKYAIQITVADERDGALSGSTLKEASSWGKVETTYEQMVYGEATVFFPLIAGYAYHKGLWKNRQPKRYADYLNKQ
ncbi:MAG: deoxyhypusine synthase [Ignavibacteria bacterium]|jgi:deoxyhypusine synthase|nr:deoxyhypusine synthase [Ignavibacteria bacterium]